MTPQELSDFSVGDRVEVVNDMAVGFGKTGVVRDAGKSRVVVSLDNRKASAYYYERSSLKILPSKPPKFKVGDRVEIVPGLTESGKRGEISSLTDRGNFYIKFDDGGGTYCFTCRGLRLLIETENQMNKYTYKPKENRTMKLTQVQKQYTTPDNIAILEAFYLSNGTLDTSSEEFGLWFMNQFGSSGALLDAAHDKLIREEKETE